MSKLCTLLLFMFCSSAFGITVKPLELYGTEDELVSRVIKVTNSSKHDEFVRVNLYQLLNPGTPEEKEVKVENADSLEMSVYPRRFKVGPGEFKQVRLLLPNSNIQSEKLYRVRFVPVSSFDKGVTIQVSYGVLLRVLPVNKVPTLQYLSDEEGVNQFTNTGNVRLHVYSLCQSEQRADFRIYPGASIEIKSGCKAEDYEFKDDGGNIIPYTPGNSEILSSD
ncbi:hypothetical protein KUV56_02445 [Ferrimonas balearica]|uniref:hypothetical protein n=1 Tax=Ferrimonas balearica TaxID=44012 RepID=UPI001C57562D|nr:hypothetical protein [Ferrimonas balearica]MBW3138385.1 hypothetical protein [Ferrimonas balearica]